MGAKAFVGLEKRKTYSAMVFGTESSRKLIWAEMVPSAPVVSAGTFEFEIPPMLFDTPSVSSTLCSRIAALSIKPLLLLT
jgi:hypothetical protein